MKFFDRFRKKKEGEQPDVSPAQTTPEPVEPPEQPVPDNTPAASPVPLPRPAGDLGSAAGPVIAPPGTERPVPVAPDPVATPVPSPASPPEFAPASSSTVTAEPPPVAIEPVRQPVPSPVAPVAPVAAAPAVDQSAAAEAVASEAAASETKGGGWFSRLKEGLKRTSNSFSEGVGNLFLGRKEIDDELLEELETRLITADLGIEATLHVTGNLTRRVSRKEVSDAPALYRALQEELATLLEPASQPLVIDATQKPFVILMVGVNGVGKTTTIGKLAHRYLAEGRSVMLAAGDTFRAAAVEQLQVWGERNNVPVIAQHSGADSASVLFDALQAAKARNIDVLIADTAGRLHNKEHLMEELKKVLRVMKKIDPTAPHEVMLVLDAGTGQNALTQARHFQEAVGVTGITLTKLDGTAKGGIIFGISRQCQLPIRFIGVGEKIEDLRPFVAEDFVRALFDKDAA